ncbi:hypothetical protein CCP4SC76_390008 [Gammaproteobacteria bacterium]
MNEQNPITASIEWLCDQGFSQKEATNLVQALRADNPEELWNNAPKWIEWCGKIKKEHDCIVMLVAQGFIHVYWNDDTDKMQLSLAINENER